jgi:hypothetical protein
MVYVALHGYGRIAEKTKRQGFAGKNQAKSHAHGYLHGAAMTPSRSGWEWGNLGIAGAGVDGVMVSLGLGDWHQNVGHESVEILACRTFASKRMVLKLA